MKRLGSFDLAIVAVWAFSKRVLRRAPLSKNMYELINLVFGF